MPPFCLSNQALQVNRATHATFVIFPFHVQSRSLLRGPHFGTTIGQKKDVYDDT